MSPVSIFLSDFQFLTKEGFQSLIAKDRRFELLGSEENDEQLFVALEQTHPRVLVIDYRPEDRNFEEKIERIKALGVSNILIITADTDKTRVRNVLRTGVKGMITKTCSHQEIVNSILAVSQGNRFYCNKILDIVMQNNGLDEVEECGPTDLSPREFEVLQLITKGMTTTKIADSLHVSVHTINSHRKSILKKLNLKSPAELIVYALESGMVG